MNKSVVFVVFSLSMVRFNPHPFINAPSLVGGESPLWKTGDRLGIKPRLPLFFRRIVLMKFGENTI